MEKGKCGANTTLQLTPSRDALSIPTVYPFHPHAI